MSEDIGSGSSCMTTEEFKEQAKKEKAAQRKLDKGYYYVKLRGSDEISIAYRSEERGSHPWQIIGSDEIFKDYEIGEVIKRIKL